MIHELFRTYMNFQDLKHSTDSAQIVDNLYKFNNSYIIKNNLHKFKICCTTCADSAYFF